MVLQSVTLTARCLPFVIRKGRRVQAHHDPTIIDSEVHSCYTKGETRDEPGKGSSSPELSGSRSTFPDQSRRRRLRAFSYVIIRNVWVLSAATEEICGDERMSPITHELAACPRRAWASGVAAGACRRGNYNPSSARGGLCGRAEPVVRPSACVCMCRIRSSVSSSGAASHSALPLLPSVIAGGMAGGSLPSPSFGLLPAGCPPRRVPGVRSV